jgi:hypothetical protein
VWVKCYAMFYPLLEKSKYVVKVRRNTR